MGPGVLMSISVWRGSGPPALPLRGGQGRAPAAGCHRLGAPITGHRVFPRALLALIFLLGQTSESKVSVTRAGPCPGLSPRNWPPCQVQGPGRRVRNHSQTRSACPPHAATQSPGILLRMSLGAQGPSVPRGPGRWACGCSRAWTLTLSLSSGLKLNAASLLLPFLFPRRSLTTPPRALLAPGHFLHEPAQRPPGPRAASYIAVGTGHRSLKHLGHPGDMQHLVTRHPVA